MKQFTVYQCDHCNFQTTDMQDCLAHEASKHYRITMDEYAQWKELHEKVAYAGWEVSNHSNPETRKAFDTLIETMLQFEKEHNLPDKRPRHFH